MYLLRVPMLVYKPKIMKELMPEKNPHSSKKQQFYPEVLSMYYRVTKVVADHGFEFSG